MYLRRLRHASQLSRLPLTVERHCVGSAIAALELACVARRSPAARLFFNGRFVWQCRVQLPHVHSACVAVWACHSHIPVPDVLRNRWAFLQACAVVAPQHSVPPVLRTKRVSARAPCVV